MDTKSCFFIGHREASEEIYPALYAAVEQHIVEYGVTEFIVGHYGGFDRLAASAVKEAKRFYPEVKLTLLLPYHPAERPIPTQMDLTEHSIRLEWRAFRARSQS